LNASISNAFQQLDAGHPGHRNIEDEAVEVPGNGGLQSRTAAFSFVDLKSQPPEVLGQEKSHIGIVISD
jgi:hypothetical protein